jgi:hypothetical protein
MLPTKFRFIWPIVFKGKDFLEINQSETRFTCGSHVTETWWEASMAGPL